MSKEAMKLALEALEVLGWQPTEEAMDYRDNAITALREALAEQSAQGCNYCNHALYSGTKCKNCGRVTEQAAIKQDLTPEQPAQQEPTVDDDSQDWQGMDGATAYWLIQRHADGWSDIGKMMGEWLEANQAQPAQQEPVAYVVYHRMGGSKSLHWPEQHSPDGDANEYQLLPLYTSPPAQRKPLTDEQIAELMTQTWGCASIAPHHAPSFARAIEAAHGIEEKNT